MNDDELKRLWQEQPLREAKISAAQIIAAAQSKTSHFRQGVGARDFRELLACAVVIIIFGFYAYFERTPVVRVGWLIVIASTVFIAWKLVHARRTTPPAPAGASVAESLRAELKSVRAQSRLLGSILWWYLLPPGIGLLVATWGMPIHLHAKIPSTLFFVALYAFIYWLNQRARSKQLLPLEAQLESLLSSIETGMPLDETHVGDLRPIALSMASAQAVKPVEFKVAFWQIALWGEIGFIGIWFFLMLALALNDPKSQTVEPPANRIVETNRYSIVAGTVVNYLNAGDFGAIQALFNDGMAAALPPDEGLEFFTRLTGRYGEIQSFEGPTRDGFRGWTAFRLHGEHRSAMMSLALDENDRIAGIHFRPARAPINMRSLALQIFSPRRLVLIVPFFLAGLLFSWLLQKATERAVGISTLGIHLCKGLNLIPWEEIKDVHASRFLNIRSLRLIKESGEKEIMPWSSLERHSELKTAVESCAPANHPLRKYLSLLK